MNTKQAIIRSAGLRGKTKQELADSVGLSLSHTAKTVNDLVDGGDLQLARVTSSGASVFAKPASGVTSSLAQPRSRSRSVK